MPEPQENGHFQIFKAIFAATGQPDSRSPSAGPGPFAATQPSRRERLFLGGEPTFTESQGERRGCAGSLLQDQERHLNTAANKSRLPMGRHCSVRLAVANDTFDNQVGNELQTTYKCVME
jgi:hypothetical protein